MNTEPTTSDEVVLTSQFLNGDDPLPEYRGNPLIGALGPIPTPEQCTELMYKDVPSDSNLADLPPHVVAHAVRRLTGMFIPMTYHEEAMRESDIILRQGYAHRNPLCPKYRRRMAQDRSYLKANTPPPQRFSQTPLLAQLIAGYVGTGKTTVSNFICSMYPQVVSHAYVVDDVTIVFTQVPYVRLVLMHDASLKAFAIEFFNALEAIVGDPGFKKKWRPDLCSNANAAILIYSAVMEYRIGMIIVDDSQNIKYYRDGAKAVLNYFVRIINTMGIPVILVGTNVTRTLIAADPTFARRFTCDTPEFAPLMPAKTGEPDGPFELLLAHLAKHCPAFDWRKCIWMIYQITGGIPDLMVKLVTLALGRVYGRKNGVIDDKVIKETASRLFGVVDGLVEEIKGEKKERQEIVVACRVLEQAHKLLCNEALASIGNVPFPEAKAPVVEVGPCASAETSTVTTAVDNSLRPLPSASFDPREVLKQMGAFRPLK